MDGYYKPNSVSPITVGDTLNGAIGKLEKGLDLKADINSPTFTGVPKAPTVGINTNNNQIATTQFVQAVVSNAVGDTGIKSVDVDDRVLTITKQNDEVITFEDTDTTYSAGTGLVLNDTTFSADGDAIINSLTVGNSTPVDNDYFISQYAGGGTTTTSYHRRQMSKLWDYIKSKTDVAYPIINSSGTTRLDSTTNTLDDIKTAGTYRWSNDYNNGKPSDTPCNYGKMFVIDTVSNGYVIQLVYSHNGEIYQRRWSRLLATNNGWDEWKKVGTAAYTDSTDYATANHTHPQYLTSVSWGDVGNKPSFATVATSGSYTDLSNTPTIPTVPTNISSFTNDSGYITGVAWGDVTNKPSVVTTDTTQDITARKTFTLAPNMRSSSYTKGDIPQNTTYPLWQSFLEQGSGSAEKNRLGALGIWVNTNGDIATNLYAYKNEVNSTTASSISIVYPKTGTSYATCPTPDASANDTKIATTAWVNTKLGSYSDTSHNHDSRYFAIGTAGLTSIPKNTDLDTLTVFGNYTCGSWSGTGDTYTNCPSGLNSGFKLFVVSTNGSNYMVQILLAYSNGSIWVRGKGGNGAWSAWRKVVYDNFTLENKPRTIEFISGTQTAATNAFTGVSGDSALYNGKMIAYYLPYAGTSSGDTLNLTLSNGTTTGAKTVWYRKGVTQLTTHMPANTVVLMVYTTDGDCWTIQGQYNTTYSAMSETEANTGTATTARTITAARLHDKIKALVNQAMTANNLQTI